MHRTLQISEFALVTLLATGLLLIPVLSAGPVREVPAAAASVPEAVEDVQIAVDQVVASGLVHPVQVTHAGDGSGRLFVVEQPGRIRVIKDGALLSTPFLDLTALTDDAGEQGLLGLAFHPDYGANGHFYVDYTRATDGATVVARYAVSDADPDRALASSGLTILTVAQPYANHNGGQLAFGPDGYLYIGLGDGGSGGDPLENGQDNTTLLGSILRVDVDQGPPYAIPPDNPYVNATGLDEIWAIGLRNPWRFSFDRATGDLYIGDVGQNQWEEISFQATGTPGGVNFGWDCKEGTHDYEWDAFCAQQTLTDPITEYSHAEGQSVTGGFVYRGTLYPALEGLYFYADYVSGKIWSLDRDAGSTTPQLELDTAFNITGFGEDEGGELYIVTRDGTVRRLVDTTGPAPAPNFSGAYKAPSVPAADPGETVTYTLALVNTGGAVPGTLALADTVPAGLSYQPGSLHATAGAVDDTGAPTLRWHGTVGSQTTVTVAYQVEVTGAVTGSLVNHAQLSGDFLDPIDLPSALFVPRSVLTTTMRDLFLPGTQPGTLTAEIRDAVDCNICHSAPIYDAWRGTMMSQSGRDPLLHAALATANHDAPAAGDYCLRCHTPKGWLEGRSHPADGSALSQADIANGVTCALCHRMVDPRLSGGETTITDTLIVNALTTTIPTTYTGSGTLVVDPEDRRRGPFAFDPDLPYHTAYQTAYLGQSSDPVTRSRLCGTCHNVDNPVLSWDAGRSQYWPNGMDAAPDPDSGFFPIERTFTEWANSAYPGGVTAPQFAGDEPGGVVSACQDCHLERQTGTATDAQFLPVTRDCTTTGCLPEHQMVGGNAWVPHLLQDPAWRLDAAGEGAYLDTTAQSATAMLRRAATLSVTLEVSGTTKVATVRVTNETGHKLPTGYPEGRQMWLHVRAYDADGQLVYESGRYDTTEHRLVRDADARVYEVKQGLTPELAALVGKPAGASFHFILNNAVVKDNRIPPRGYTVTAWDQDGLRPVDATYDGGQHWDDVRYVLPLSAARVTAVLYYQTASREYVDFLRAHGGVDGESLHDLWRRSPSPPVLVAMAGSPPLPKIYLPLVMKTY